MPRFPAPYKNDTVLDDPIMERIPVPGAKFGIGQGTASRPSSIDGNDMVIKHTGGELGKGE